MSALKSPVENRIRDAGVDDAPNEAALCPRRTGAPDAFADAGTRTHVAWPRLLATVLGGGAAVVAAFGLIGQWLRHVHGVQNSLGFIFQFAPNEEGNLSTWYSSTLLLVCAALLGATAWRSAGSRYRRHWMGLSLLLAAMSADETAQAHEMLIRPLREFWNLGGVLHYAWVVPGALLVLSVLVACVGFLRALPRRSLRLFAAAAVLYLGGALGVEMAGGYYASQWGSKTFNYALLTCLEEAMEMSGAVLLAYGLTDHLCRYTTGTAARPTNVPART